MKDIFSVRLRLAMAATTLACAASAASAQASASSRGTDSLPRDLVVALLRTSYGGGARDAEFFVGKVPPVLEPYLYIPKDARVLGGYTSSFGTTVAFTVRGMKYEDVAGEYYREQLKLGWTPPPSANDLRGWGFQPAPTASPAGGLEFCHIGQSLQIMPSVDMGVMTLIAQVQNFGGRCSMTNRSVVGGRTPAPTALPLLFNPAATNMNTQACIQYQVPTTGISSTSERIEASDSPTRLLDYFGKQLADSGWTVSGTNVVRRQWTRPDTASMVREVTVTMTPYAGPTGASCADVTMSVRMVPASQIKRCK